MTQQPTPPSAAIVQLLERARRESAFRQRLMAAPLDAAKNYDLTAAERDWLVLPNFSWLVDGELGGSARPGSTEALGVLSAAGVRVLLNLGEQPLPEAGLAGANIRVVELPVADFTAPTPAQLDEAIAAVEQAVAQGQPLVVCCGAGLGRTGTVLAATLVRRGRSAAKAIAEVRARRPGSIETPEQEAAIAAYERAQRGTPASDG